MLMKKGDYIYYYNSYGDTLPAVVKRVMRVYMWINDGSNDLKVKIKSCELQKKEKKSKRKNHGAN